MAKGKLASWKVRNILMKSRVTSNKVRKKLLNAFITSTLLYAGQIWAVDYVNQIEKVQLQFIKRILNLNMSTPNSFIRLEFGLNPLKVAVFKLMLNFLLKILKMPSGRLPRICFDVLYQKHLHGSFCKYNWISKLNSFLTPIGSAEILRSLDQRVIKQELKNLILQFKNMCLSEDIHYVVDSCRFNAQYRNLSALGLTENYLDWNCSINLVRIVLQLRLANLKIATLYCNGIKYVFDSNSICSLCHDLAPDSLIHFLFDCPVYQVLRTYYLEKYIDSLSPPQHQYQTLLSIGSKLQMCDVYNYVSEAVKIKSFLMNE